MTRTVNTLFKMAVWFMVVFPLVILTASAVSWVLSYAISLQASSINAQRATFGYYQDLLSDYTLWLLPVAAVFTLALAIRIVTAKKNRSVQHSMSLQTNNEDQGSIRTMEQTQKAFP